MSNSGKGFLNPSPVRRRDGDRRRPAAKVGVIGRRSALALWMGVAFVLGVAFAAVVLTH